MNLTSFSAHLWNRYSLLIILCLLLFIALCVLNIYWEYKIKTKELTYIPKFVVAIYRRRLDISKTVGTPESMFGMHSFMSRRSFTWSPPLLVAVLVLYPLMFAAMLFLYIHPAYNNGERSITLFIAVIFFLVWLWPMVRIVLPGLLQKKYWLD